MGTAFTLCDLADARTGVSIGYILEDTLRLFVFHMLSLEVLFAFGAVNEDIGGAGGTTPSIVHPVPVLDGFARESSNECRTQ